MLQHFWRDLNLKSYFVEEKEDGEYNPHMYVCGN